MSDPVLLEIDDDGIGTLTFNRPHVRNALNWAAMEAFSAAIDHAEQADDLRVLIMTGEGRKAFIAGGDVREFHDNHTKDAAYRMYDKMTVILDRVTALRVPVIAALEGATRGGGCEVALAADIRVAAKDATFAFTQVRMGLSPGWGGSQRLYSLIGYRAAMQLLMTGRVVTVPEARILGLVDLTTHPGHAMQEALRFGRQIVENPPLAVRGIKEVLLAYHSLPTEEARKLEREVFAQLWVSNDHQEAASAFLEKRDPTFTGE